MPSHSELRRMSQMEIGDIDPETLVNISGLTIDPALPQTERMDRYLTQVRNPYCFLSGDTVVRVRFVNPNQSLSQALVSYFSRRNSI